MRDKADVPQGTLALMVLRTLDVLGPLHGYGIARRIEQISGDLPAVNQATLNPVLLKLEQEGSIASEWALPRIIARRGFICSPKTGAGSCRRKSAAGSRPRRSWTVFSK